MQSSAARLAHHSLVHETSLSSAWALADRVVIGLSAGDQGVVNLQREREFVLNPSQLEAARRKTFKVEV